jgi:hypothetical protein
MATKYKPQLNHFGFDWIEQASLLERELTAKRTEILESLNFYVFYSERTDVLTTAGHEVIRELSGIVSQAAAIRMDAGFKAPNKLVATLNAVKKDPSLIFTEAVEPEAFGKLASQYQRCNERPGTYWFDLEGYGARPDPQRIAIAASNAILGLKSEAKPGRLPDIVTGFVALKAREIFLQYNGSITRHSIASSRLEKDTQVEAGPFLEFLELLLAPLNQFFSRLSKDYQATPVSAAQVVRAAVDFGADQLRHRRRHR